VNFSCDDTGSGIASCTGDTTLGEGANQSVTGTATDLAGNTATDTTPGINIDTTAPVISNTTTVTGTKVGDWYTSDVTVTFKATDNLSGFTGSTNPHTFTKTTSGDGSAVTVDSGTVNDRAGNPSDSITSTGYKIDQVAPFDVTFMNGPSAGSSSYFGSVPAGPTCTADDATSGVASCVVTGYSTAVGTTP
jgi:hypothetical protein